MKNTIHHKRSLPKSFAFFALVIFLVTTILNFGMSQTCMGQAKKGKQDTPAFAKPEVVVLETNDKVQLKCTYFAPGNADPNLNDEDAGKSVVPMILLHDWEGDRSQLMAFATYLQKAGRAVIVPDLRGHGESTELTGFPRKLDYKKFRRMEIASVQKDIERCKKYLVQRHNEGKVNIDLLTLMAIGKTTPIAVQWTLNDWFAFPAKNADGIKQGQDVKALILISPPKKMDRMTLSDQLKNKLFAGESGNTMPLMILWGRNEKSAKDSEYVYDKLAKLMPDLSEIEDSEERAEKKTLYRVRVKQDFSGVELFEKQKAKGLWDYVNKFVQDKVGSKASQFAWKSRRPKVDDE